MDNSKTYCSQNKYFIEHEGDDIVLKDSSGAELGRANRDHKTTVARYLSPKDLKMLDLPHGEMSPDELVYHFLRLDEYAAWTRQERGTSTDKNSKRVDRHIDTEAIPLVMRKLPQWLVWRYQLPDPSKPEGAGNKLTKVPYNAGAIEANRFAMLPNRGGKASTKDSQTWCTFETALEVHEKCRDLTGIGFCFSDKDGLTGIDLDHCFDETEKLLPWAQEIVEHFDGTYVEVSPSGEGLHIWCSGKAIKAGKRIVISRARGVEEAIEIYDFTSPRYFTVTGKPFRRNPC